jgi:hypothetical protein
MRNRLNLKGSVFREPPSESPWRCPYPAYLVDREMVEQASDVAGELCQHVTGVGLPGRAAPAKIGRDYPIARRQRRHVLLPETAAHDPLTDQHNRAAGTLAIVVQRNPVGQF